jgi:hypothetical protein
MTVRDRVTRTQNALQLLFVVAVLAWGAAVFLAFDALGLRTWIAAFTASVTVATLAWHWRSAFSFDRAALWIEERAPQLRYALVTAVDPRHASPAFDRAIEPLFEGINVGRFLRRPAIRITAPALIALSAALVIPSLPASSSTRAGPSVPVTTVISNRLLTISARLTPPGYSGIASTSVREPSTISALRGTQVVLTGRDGWRREFTMGDTAPSLMSLEDRQYKRHVVIDPRVDQAPNVTLRRPVKDTTLRVIAGSLDLAADLTDDVGLSRARFEYIVSTGSQERFEFREGALGAREVAGTKRARLEISVPYASFKLHEGDRLSVRAVSWDNNTLYGPGKGTSETRTIRVASKGEYDSIAVNRAPPSADTAMMSLRMLIIATEKLQSERRKLERPAFVAEAKKLGGQSESIRRKIQQIIDETTDGGQIAPDTLLTTALGAMWEATRELHIASPNLALPPMYVAYKALQSLRNAKRYYIRGLQKPIIVNIERVRLAGGSDTGTATSRMPRAAERSIIDQLRASYLHAVRLMGDSAKGDSAMMVLMTMRVATLRAVPSVATALGDAIAAMQSGNDATPALVRTRRLLETTMIKLDSLPAWSGAWRR